MKLKIKSILRPCPFCGGKVREKRGIMGLRFFRCDACGSLTSFDSDRANEDPALAVKLWNTRAEV